MRRPPALALVVVLALFAAGVGWYLTHRVDSRPVALEPQQLARWTLVTSDGTDPWVVALQPPDRLVALLLATARARAGVTLVAPAHAALPLVLRTEFEESLQGVYGVDSVQRIARDAGLDTAAFTPVCLAHRTASGPSGRAELYFVPFESAAFVQMRVDLTPTEPEHAGIGVYDPGTVTPILVVGATDAAFDRWWPLAFDPTKDCEAPIAGS